MLTILREIGNRPCVFVVLGFKLDTICRTVEFDSVFAPAKRFAVIWILIAAV